MGAVGWAVVAFACVALRVLGAVLVGAGRVPACSGPLVEVLLWIGGPAILDPDALANIEFWAGLVGMLLLWAPALVLASSPSTRRRTASVALTVVAVLALVGQAAATQLLLAGTVSEATAGHVCQPPRKTTELSGEDLFPAPPGTVEIVCVQGRPGGGYLGD